MKNKYLSLIEELNIAAPKEKFTIKMIDSEFLNKIINKEEKSDKKLPYLTKTSVAIILRVTTLKVAEYASGAEMEDWRKARLVQMINLLHQEPFENRARFTNWVTNTILEKRKTNSPLKELNGLETFLIAHYVEIFKSSKDWDQLQQLKTTTSRSLISPDLVIKNDKLKKVEIIEFDFSNNTQNQAKKLHQLSYYLFYLANNKIPKISGFDISGVLICSKSSKQLVIEAKHINVSVKELMFRLKDISN